MENRLPLRISLPFVAGVGAGALSCDEISLLLCLLFLFLLLRSSRHDRIFLYLMLFFLGMFCYSARSSDLLSDFGWSAFPGQSSPSVSSAPPLSVMPDSDRASPPSVSSAPPLSVMPDSDRASPPSVSSTPPLSVMPDSDRASPPFVISSERSESRNLLSSALSAFRAAIDRAGFAPETSALLRALMTGDRSGLGRATVQMFRHSGASHLLALSGLHLGIIAMILRWLLMILGNSRPAAVTRSLLLVALCSAYTLACGASPSLVRALLFVALQQTASLSPGRSSPPADRLCVAATIQLALNPLVINSVAFQLSYLAMIGVVVLAPRLEAWYPTTRVSARVDPFRHIWKAASLAISCQLTTAPVVWARFGSLPRYFLLTNLLAMPLCELLLPAGLLTLALGSPSCLVRLTDLLASLFLRILSTIAGM